MPVQFIVITPDETVQPMGFPVAGSSSYTAKALVAVTPDGVNVFVSDAVRE
jgi:hypothetical protein